MRDWSEDLKRRGLSFMTLKRPSLNQRCLDQFWEKLDRDGQVFFHDLKHCSECISTVKALLKQKEVRLTAKGYLKKPLPPM